jgi:hypothetical protein
MVRTMNTTRARWSIALGTAAIAALGLLAVSGSSSGDRSSEVATAGDGGGDSAAAKKAERVRLRNVPAATREWDGWEPATPQPDVGDPATIAAVKADFHAGVVARGKLLAYNDLPSGVESLVSNYMASSAVASEVASLEEIVAGAVSSNWPAYADFDFVIDAWYGIQVSGATAHGVLIGRNDLLRNGSWQRSDPIQYVADLVLEGGDWKFVSMTLDFHE